MKIKQTGEIDLADTVSRSNEAIQNCPGRTEAGQMETKAYATTASTKDFKAHGNNSRIAIDNGDDQVQIKDNTYAFDNAAIDYLGCLSFTQVITAAYHEKRAQDKTTVHKSEFSFRSDGLCLSQTVQLDNVLAAASSYFTYNASGRVIFDDRPNGIWSAATEYVYDDSQSDTNPRNKLSATSKYRVTTTGSVAPPFTTQYHRAGRSIRVCTVGFDLQSIYQYIGYNKSVQADCIVKDDYAATESTYSTKTTFDTQGRADVVTAPDDTRAKTIFYDRLHRLTDANAVGASTAAIRCDDLGAKTNRTPNPGLGDVSAYGCVNNKTCVSDTKKNTIFQKNSQFTPRILT